MRQSCKDHAAVVEIAVICREIRAQGFDILPALPLLTVAPFGADSAADALSFLQSASAWRTLTERGECSVLLITDQSLDHVPDWITVMRVTSVPLWPEGPRFANRFFKWALPLLVPQAPLSVYTDTANVLPVNRPKNIRRLFELIRRERFVVTRHTRPSWHDEVDAIRRWPDKVADPARLDRQQQAYEAAGLPDDAPIYINSFVGRDHSSPSARRLSQLVLEQLQEYSERDQLALPFAVSKSGLRPYAAENGDLYSSWHGTKKLNRRSIVFVDRKTHPKRIGWLTMRLISQR